MEERQALDAALVENFGVDESKIVAESISGAISAEMKSDAIVATVIATIFMLLYIWVRFKNIRFAASAVIALVHDVLVWVACYALQNGPWAPQPLPASLPLSDIPSTPPSLSSTVSART